MKKSSSISKKKPIMRAVLILCLSLFVLGLVMTIHQAANAASSDSSEFQLLETYREKKYKGALDEEELKVLADLQTSDSKKKKSQESEEGF
ncbi:MAG: hypothetical protein V4654_04600 [Bdellovibrionota bacterium]